MNTRHQNDFIDSATLYSHHNNYDGMIEQIHNYVKSAKMPIRFGLFFSTKEVSDYFNTGTYGEYKIERQYHTDNIYIGELCRTYGREKDKKIHGRFLLYKHIKYDIYIFLTDGGMVYFEDGLHRYILNKYPHFSSPFFYSWEMEVILNSLSNKTPHSRIMLTQISRKSRLRGGSRKKKESDLTWTDLYYKDVFKEARQNDAWVEKVHFDLVAEIKTEKGSQSTKVLTGAISRNGTFKCEMDFKLFNETIIEKATELFVARKEKLSNRERSKETNFEGKPLFIQFEDPIFKNKEQNRRLITVLKNLPHTANSVIHANPYLHVSMMDYVDKSNYEIWVLSDNRIAVSPQTVCSVGSLNRLLDHISKEFQEGKVMDIKEGQQNVSA